MSFLGHLLNSIPVVGHIKGIIHYVCDDEEGGDRAMRVATRSAALVGAVSVGALAGPAGAVAAGIATGAAYDTTTAIVTDGKQVSGVAKIFTEPGKISSWVGAGVDMAFDGLPGIGGGLTKNVVKETGKIMAKKSAEKVVIKEAEKLAVRIVANIALNAACKESASPSDGRRTSTADDSSKRPQTNGGGNRVAKDVGKSNSGDPGDRRDGSEDEKKECQGATTQQLKELLRIVERIEEFMMGLRYVTDDHLLIINQYLQEFIETAIPLMNDPTVRLEIRGGILDIEMLVSGNRIGISRRQAALLWRAIQDALSNPSSVDPPCSRLSCRFCPNLREVQTEHGWTGNCETRNVIYSFYCRDCDRIVYAGQTTQLLRDRMSGHLNNEHSPLRSHIDSTPGHRSASHLLDMYRIVIMWTSSSVDTGLDGNKMKRIIRNWEVLMQWLTNAHKSLGGESRR